LAGGDLYPYTSDIGYATSNSRIEALRREIEEIREKRKKYLHEGVQKVQSYMKQLRREHAEHAKEMRSLRLKDAENGNCFISQIEEINYLRFI
jgi:FtsZ-binding cell division protein ZapB